MLELLPYLEQLARVIDEDEHHQYISMVLLDETGPEKEPKREPEVLAVAVLDQDEEDAENFFRSFESTVNNTTISSDDQDIMTNAAAIIVAAALTASLDTTSLEEQDSVLEEEYYQRSLSPTPDFAFSRTTKSSLDRPLASSEWPTTRSTPNAAAAVDWDAAWQQAEQNKRSTAAESKSKSKLGLTNNTINATTPAMNKRLAEHGRILAQKAASNQRRNDSPVHAAVDWTSAPSEAVSGWSPGTVSLNNMESSQFQKPRARLPLRVVSQQKRYSSSKLASSDGKHLDHIATGVIDQDIDLMLDSRIEKRWRQAQSQRDNMAPASSDSDYLQEESPTSIVDTRTFQQPLLYKPPLPQKPIIQPDNFRRVDETEDLSFNVSRRQRALQPFKACVKCLLD
jgi:hypothetical protein